MLKNLLVIISTFAEHQNQFVLESRPPRFTKPKPNASQPLPDNLYISDQTIPNQTNRLSSTPRGQALARSFVSAETRFTAKLKSNALRRLHKTLYVLSDIKSALDTSSFDFNEIRKRWPSYKSAAQRFESNLAEVSHAQIGETIAWLMGKPRDPMSDWVRHQVSIIRNRLSEELRIAPGLALIDLRFTTEELTNTVIEHTMRDKIQTLEARVGNVADRISSGDIDVWSLTPLVNDLRQDLQQEAAKSSLADKELRALEQLLEKQRRHQRLSDGALMAVGGASFLATGPIAVALGTIDFAFVAVSLEGIDDVLDAAEVHLDPADALYSERRAHYELHSTVGGIALMSLLTRAFSRNSRRIGRSLIKTLRY